MLGEIGTVDNIPEFIEGVKNRWVLLSDSPSWLIACNFVLGRLIILLQLGCYRKRKMSGFGHRVYKNYDPRAKVIRKLAEEVFLIVGRDPLIEVYFAAQSTNPVCCGLLSCDSKLCQVGGIILFCCLKGQVSFAHSFNFGNPCPEPRQKYQFRLCVICMWSVWHKELVMHLTNMSIIWVCVILRYSLILCLPKNVVYDVYVIMRLLPDELYLYTKGNTTQILKHETSTCHLSLYDIYFLAISIKPMFYVKDIVH